MIVAMAVLLVTSLLLTATFMALTGDAHLSQTDLNGKRAYYAAEAGANAYLYQLNQNSNYWTSCSNDVQTITTVPGATTGEQYSFSPIPANGNSACSSSSPISTLIDTATGTLRMTFVGYAGTAGSSTPQVQRAIVASFRKASPLDYLWFTRYEALDASISGYTDCAVYYRDGRPGHCDINWVTGDTMNGPMYTMDQYLISGSPTFGRYPSDSIESLASGPPNSAICTASNCGSANLQGTAKPGISGVNAPADNSGLLTDASNHGKTYNGTTSITLLPSSTNATVTNCPGISAGTPLCTTSTVDISLYPIIYVSNASGCTPAAYNPYGAGYPTSTVATGSNYYGCAGDVYVSGSYTTPLTIAAANDIVIKGNLSTPHASGAPTGTAVLGLVANDFVRVMHGFSGRSSNTFQGCGGGSDVGGQTLLNPTIDAAILALKHSFIVDNFDCGSPSNTGNLTVNGALVQYFRGAVGTGGGSGVNSGYLKSYSYDNRLAVLLPPYLFDISTSGWLLNRQTVCVPGGSDPNTQC